MVEAELESVESQASDWIQIFDAIPSVTDNRMSQVLHVDSDLVFPSSFQMQFYE